MQAIPISPEKQLYRNQEKLTQKDLEAVWKEVRSRELQYVDLSYNKSVIAHLVVPKNLPHLQYLYLYDSQIQKITFEGDLSNLEVLHLGKNQLKEFVLPEGFGALEHLRLDGNELQHFELEDYHRLESMQSLFLEKNDLQEIPKENWEKGGNCWELVRAYLEAAESGLIINQEAKVVWFGNGRAGKTTLSYQLRERLFKDFEQTHGIEIKDWKIPYERLPQALKDRMTASLAEAKAQHPQTKLELPAHIVLKLWDFGGQEYYHATHRLFLNSNVLYLLVWNQATDFQAEDADPAKCIYPRSYWRHNIQYYAEEGEIILEIQNKAQQEAYTNRAALQYKVAYRNAEQPRSLQRYELDVADLEDAIIAQLSNLTYLGQTFPEVYDHIRQALRDNPKDYLSYADYVAFCEEQDTTRGKGKENLMQQATQIKALTEFLHDTGTLICYRYTPNCPELLKDFVFIRPQWVTDMIYRILDKKLVDQKDNPGEFDKRYVEQVTQESGLSADTWIELMKQFQLIFEVNREGKVYFIAPQYLPMDCTNLIGKKWALKSNPVHQFSLHFPRFLPKSHFLQFVAEFGSLNIEDLYWKNGLIFSKNGHTIYAQCDYPNRQISLYISEGKHQAQTRQEVYQWFVESDKLNEYTEVSVDGMHFVPIEEVNRHGSQNIPLFIHSDYTFVVNDFGFVLGRHSITHTKQTVLTITHKDFIQKLIQKDSIGQAISELLKGAKKTQQKEIDTNMNLLSARHSSNEKDKIDGMTSEANYKVEKNKIVNTLIYYLGEYESDEIYRPEPKTVTKQVSPSGHEVETETSDSDIPEFFITEMKKQFEDEYKKIQRFEKLLNSMKDKEMREEFDEDIDLCDENIARIEKRYLKKIKRRQPDIPDATIQKMIDDLRQTISKRFDQVDDGIQSLQFSVEAIEYSIQTHLIDQNPVEQEQVLQLLQEIKQRVEKTQAPDKEAILGQLNADISASAKLKLTIPLIPGILKYEQDLLAVAAKEPVRSWKDLWRVFVRKG